MKSTKEIIDQFLPITLQEMKTVRLLNRIDNKYVTTVEKLDLFLEMAKNDYYVQEVPDAQETSNSETRNIRLIPYHTIYLDTPDLDMYYAHEHGRSHRFKVRMRKYEASGDTFLEVKNKSNQGRTRKKRTEISELTYDNQQKKSFVDCIVPYDASTLKPVIENHFERITLVNKDKTERLTIDTNLWFHNLKNNQEKSLPKCIVIELKREGRIQSPALSLFRQLHIKPQGFSKMALGLAMTDVSLKKNLFKERLRLIEKLNN